MLISLEEPFKSLWRNGYLQTHQNGRKYLCLFNSQDDRTLISYARYLYSIHLGYVIPDEYEVDHKNNDPTDDRINNYQLLTKEQNRLKQEWWYNAMVQEWYIVHCAHCHGLFYLTQRLLNMKIQHETEYLFCSRTCASSFNSKNKYDIDINLIKQLKSEGLSSYKISNKTGYSRNTVMKYW